MLIELKRDELLCVSGGFWSELAIAITVANAAYEFYQGYSDHRK